MFVSISIHSCIICSFRYVIIHNADLVLFVALLRQNFPDLPPLTVELSHTPDLLCCPCVRDAFHNHFDHISLDAVLGPSGLQEFICVEIRQLDNSARYVSVTRSINDCRLVPPPAPQYPRNYIKQSIAVPIKIHEKKKRETH